MSRLDTLVERKQENYLEQTGGYKSRGSVIGCVEPMEMFIDDKNWRYCHKQTPSRCDTCAWKFENDTSALIRELSGAIDAGSG